MQWLRQRVEAVVDVRGTSDAARLGRWLLALQGLLVAATGWWVAGADRASLSSAVLGVLTAGCATATTWLPWDRWRTRMLVVYPAAGLVMLAVLGTVAPSVGSAYTGFLTLWFMYVGLVGRVHAGLLLMLPAAGVWVVLQGSLGPEKIVRLALAGLVWGVLAEVLALATSASKVRTEGLAHQAETDPLTGLPNRRALEASMSRLSGGDVVVVVDLDHFKQVNDGGGHAFGDQVLVDFAQTLSGCVRGSDLVARYGGEEFVLVLPQVSSHGLGAASVMARLRGQWSLLHPDITWSAGVSCHEQGNEPRTTLREADRALYRAKAAGRDRVVAASEARELVGVATADRG
ncbi:GGDEF domain-containing protein [Angustibacter luteus]|uniref:GGDEF domain-containing protein n=1 Tax=Angustibacter luteus TaxID=658456 RepID=A0ABW1JCY2_9ACTN